MIVFEGRFPAGYIRPIGRGITLDYPGSPHDMGTYLDDWFEDQVRQAGGGENLTGITIRVETEAAAGSRWDVPPSADR